MALEVIKATTYQNAVNTASNISDAGINKNVNLTDIRSDVEDKAGNVRAVSEQHIKSEISKANTRLKTQNIRCEFGYHDDTNRVTIKVLDRDTDEVIREIPPEKTLEMIQKMWELAGFLVDERR